MKQALADHGQRHFEPQAITLAVPVRVHVLENTYGYGSSAAEWRQ